MFTKAMFRFCGPLVAAVLVVGPGCAEEPTHASPQEGTATAPAATAEDTAGATTDGSAPAAGERWVETNSGMAFRFIPPGTWTMGSPENEPGRGRTETPHEVSITRGFWIGETEVTRQQWNEVMETDPTHFVACGSACPVESMSWKDALEFCNAFSRKAGLEECYSKRDGNLVFAGLDCTGFRLPSEAEWEWAARAGTTTALYTGDLTIAGSGNGPELDAIAWYGGNSGVEYEGGTDCSRWKETQHPASSCGTHTVGQKKPNPWGLYDMIGNVWEWTVDGTGSYPQQPLVDPVASVTSAGRVVRGCAWDSAAAACRVANRGMNTPNGRSDSIGLRLARTATAPSPPPSTGSATNN